MSDPPQPDRTEPFLRLLSQHDRQLSLYVSGLIPSPQDAQDILQEGKIVMWRCFDRFEMGTNFPAWARKILFHQVIAHRRRVKKDNTETIGERALELLSDEAESALREGRWVQREKALSQCLTKLTEDHRRIIQMRYRDEATIERIALAVERTETAVYRLLSRLRLALFQCVERTSHLP
jgi:RNA polymerase sigma-70 factor (ECF subfamily)